MTENNVKTLRPANADTEGTTLSGNGREDLKEMKTLIWLGIVSAWIILGLLLFIGSGSYRNSRAIQALNNPERFAAVLEEIDDLRKEVAETREAVGSAAGDLKTQVSGVAGTIESALDATARETREDLAKISEAQSRTGSQILSGQSALSESITQAFANQQRMIGNGQDQLQASLDRLVSEQQALLEAVKSDSIQNTERRQILKQFFENQTTLLEKLSETFGPAAGETAPKG